MPPQLIKPRRFRGALPNGIPQIDWSNPITAGLLGFYLPGQTGGLNIANPSVFPGVPIGSPMSAPTAVGMAYYNPSNTNIAYWRINTAPVISALSNWAAISGFVDTSGTTNYTKSVSVYSERAPSGGNDILDLQYSPGGAGHFQCTLRNDQSTLLNPNAGPLLNDGKPHVFGASFDSVNLVTYCDGQFNRSDAWPGSSNTRTDSGLVSCIGRDPSNGNAWTGFINFVALWVRTLGAPEQYSLGRDPYQFLVSPQDRTDAMRVGKASSGGGGGGTVIPSRSQIGLDLENSWQVPL